MKILFEQTMNTAYNSTLHKNICLALIFVSTFYANPVDTGRKLNVYKTFRRRPGRLLNVLCTLNLRRFRGSFTLIQFNKKL